MQPRRKDTFPGQTPHLLGGVAVGPDARDMCARDFQGIRDLVEDMGDLLIVDGHASRAAGRGESTLKPSPIGR